MKTMAIVGGQWGDEGKGKVVDVLGERFDVVVRYQGGENAGHTVEIDGESYFFHLLPSGSVRPGKICVIGNGVVVNPATLLKEIESIESRGLSVRDRLKVSSRAHLVMPYHKEIDRLRDAEKIGTTCKGIGPAYEDKMGRRGIPAAALRSGTFLKKCIYENMETVNSLLKRCLNREPVEPSEIYDEYRRYADELSDCVADTSKFLNETDLNVLFEGAQGTLLDIDHGTYPYVTSSNCCALGISAGTGVSPIKIGSITGLFKAYCTRVGEGPFPTELNDDNGNILRERGKEFGTTTGRPRRCGWFDSVAASYASRLNSFSSVAVSKLDVLDSFEDIYVCEGYRYKGSVLRDFPAEPWILSECRPELRRFKGWRTDLTGLRSFDDLPREARDYLKYLEDVLQCTADIVSVGPARNQTLIKD